MNDSEELLQDFIIEAKEHLESIEPNIFLLEQEPERTSEILNEIFRPMHSLKGASGFLGLEHINSLAHIAESVMDELRKGTLTITSEITDAIIITTDTLSKIITSLEENGTEGTIDITEIYQTLKDILERKSPTENHVETTIADSTQDISVYTPPSIDAIEEALRNFEQEPNNATYIDTICSEISAVYTYATEQKLEDISSTAHSIIELLTKSKEQETDFSILLPILAQEIQIVIDLSKKYCNSTDTAQQKPQDNNTSLPFIEDLEHILPLFIENPNISQTIERLYSTLYTCAEYADKNKWENITSTAKNTADILKKSLENNVDFIPLLPIVIQEIAIIIDLAKRYLHILHQSPTQKEHAPLPFKMPEGTQKNPTIEKASATYSSKEHEKVKHNAFIRVEHHKLDQLMNLIGELIITRNRYTLLVRSLEEGQREDILTIAQNFAETTSAMARISDALQDTIMQVRMVSLTSTFSRLPRLVRDISKKSQKEVHLVIIGEETELDKNMVEALADPLLHLIRNAVDHGIETPEERIEQGKNPIGNVFVRAFHKGNSVIIEIQDDGKGMDPEKLKTIALEKGLLTEEELRFITDDQVYELIFLPGFSGAKEITDISGRGVGMDVVRTNIKNLKGTINITSAIGVGSTFTLSFPLTLAIIEALMVEVNSQIFAIPLDTVSETTKVPKTMLKTIQDNQAITLRGEVLSIVSLYDKLGFTEEYTLPDIISIVIVTINNRKIGLIVDTLLERQEIVIKSLGKYPIASSGISGATITGDGGVILIINPYDLCSITHSVGK